MKTIVLDTNAYSALMKGDKKVEETLNHADSVLLPLFVIAELMTGFKNGNKEDENIAVLKSFEARSTVKRHFPNNETVNVFSTLFFALKKAGKPIPVHDIWIAATAIESAGVLITYDKHFSAITGLRIWNA